MASSGQGCWRGHRYISHPIGDRDQLLAAMLEYWSPVHVTVDEDEDWCPNWEDVEPLLDSNPFRPVAPAAESAARPLPSLTIETAARDTKTEVHAELPVAGSFIPRAPTGRPTRPVTIYPGGGAPPRVIYEPYDPAPPAPSSMAVRKIPSGTPPRRSRPPLPRRPPAPVLPRPRPIYHDKVCWNCGRQGHMRGACREPKRTDLELCYICGMINVTVKTCPRCAAHWKSLGCITVQRQRIAEGYRRILAECGNAPE